MTEDTPTKPVVEAEASQPSSEKKKKKKSRKDKTASTEEAATNGNIPAAPEEVPATEAAASPEDVAPEPRSENKKKKKSKSKDVEEHAPDGSPGATASEAPNPDNDIEIPDAPPMSDPDALPSSSDDTQIADLLNDPKPSPFYSTRLSLYLSLPAVAISPHYALSSLLATHLSPLLLTYFPPANGIVLAFSDPVLSARAGDALGAPPKVPSAAAAAASTSLQPRIVDDAGNEAGREVLAKASDEFGACWAWLTVRLLVFRPQRGDEVTGWANVVSEGFVGVVGYNYFQAAVGKARIPKGWRWMGATGEQDGLRKKGRKGRLGDGLLSQEAEEEDVGPVYGKRSDDDAGYFVDADGEKVPDVLKFRVVDTEMVPGHEAGSLSLQIDATLLDADAEKTLLEQEKTKYEKQQHARSGTPGGDAVMSGGLSRSRQGSLLSVATGT